MRLHDPGDRLAVDLFSDAALATLVAYPILIDAGVTAGIGRGDAETALVMSFIDVEALSFSSFATGAIKRIVDRERPVATECRRDPSYDPSCPSSGGHYSFLSGHSALSFTGAGLICVHHTQLSLLGRDGDALSCVTAMTLAAATGVSRIAADKHYATDVLSGAALGLFSGALMPYLLYYRGRFSPVVRAPGGGVIAPSIGASFLGATYARVL